MLPNGFGWTARLLINSWTLRTLRGSISNLGFVPVTVRVLPSNPLVSPVRRFPAGLLGVLCKSLVRVKSSIFSRVIDGYETKGIRTDGLATNGK